MWRSLPLLLIALPALAGGSKPTKLSWRFENVVEGFDHNHQMVVTVDGDQVASSDEGPETVPGTMTVQLPTGAESLRIVSMAQYEGEWEEHTIDNDYSVDCVWELELKNRPPKKIDMVCDIDEGPKHKMK